MDLGACDVTVGGRNIENIHDHDNQWIYRTKVSLHADLQLYTSIVYPLSQILPFLPRGGGGGL